MENCCKNKWTNLKIQDKQFCSFEEGTQFELACTVELQSGRTWIGNFFRPLFKNVVLWLVSEGKKNWAFEQIKDRNRNVLKTFQKNTFLPIPTWANVREL